MSLLSELHKEHYLSKTKHSLSINAFISFDCESNLIDNSDNTQLQTFKFLGSIFNSLDNREINIFHSTKEFYQYVSNKNKEFTTIYLFAHNLDYDIRLSNTFNELTSLGYSLDSYYNKGVIYFSFSKIEKSQEGYMVSNGKTDKKYFLAKKIRYKLVFLDTANYFSPPPSLKTLGKSLGLEKLNVDFKNVNQNDFEIYCIRDCEIVEKFVLYLINFCKDHNVEFSYSASGIAFKTFRNSFLQEKTIKIHNNRHTIKIEKKSYKGGLTIPFFIGKITNQTIYATDINSMYPNIMRNKDIPIELLSYNSYAYYNQLQLNNILSDNSKYHIIRCKMFIPINEKDKFIQITQNKENIICNGKIKDVILHQSEIDYYFPYITFIYAIWSYKKGKPFTSYIDYFYNIKKHPKTEIERNFAKMLMNSLTGKFGQMKMYCIQVSKKEIDSNLELQLLIEKYKNYSFCKLPTIIFKGKKRSFFKMNDKIIEIIQSKTIPTENSFLAIVGAITAYGRIQIMNYRDISKVENTYYTDTDSLYVNNVGCFNLLWNNMLSNYQLGKLKIEHILSEMEIFAPKAYRYIEKENQIIKIKGIKKDSILLNETEKELIFSQNEWIRLKRCLTKPNSINKQIVRKQIKIIQKTTKKGIIKDNKLIPYSL